MKMIVNTFWFDDWISKYETWSSKWNWERTDLSTNSRLFWRGWIKVRGCDKRHSPLAIQIQSAFSETSLQLIPEIYLGSHFFNSLSLYETIENGLFFGDFFTCQLRMSLNTIDFLVSLQSLQLPHLLRDRWY